MEIGLQHYLSQTREHRKMNARIQAAATTTKPATPKKKANAYEGMAALLGKGADDLMKDGDKFAMVPLTDINVLTQVREEFSDEENTDAEMDESVRKHGIFTPVLLRPSKNGPRPYDLCAGERRYRSSERTEKELIPSLIREMTDEEFADMQFAENVQRKNLTYIENAKRIQHDLDTLGSVEAVLAKHNKGRPWLSKIQSLLKLPEQTQRLVSENVTADTEVINKVKTVEKINPAKAKELVDELARTRGKADARKTADAVLAEVKPASPEKAAKKAQKQAAKTAKAADGGTVATEPDESAKEPGEVKQLDFASAKQDDNQDEDGHWPFPTTSAPGAPNAGQNPPPALPPKEALDRAYSLIKDGAKARMFLDTLSEVEREDVITWLASLYDAGKQAKDMTAAVVKGFRNEMFATEGSGAYALIAFLQGADSNVKSFNALNVLALVKD
jgi:ParB family chromosome partitioning protein